MRKLLPMGLLLMLLVVLAGCETIKGLGRDVQNAGEALEESVR